MVSAAKPVAAEDPASVDALHSTQLNSSHSAMTLVTAQQAAASRHSHDGKECKMGLHNGNNGGLSSHACRCQ